jgi:protein-S-isoprenylcysteine O-methyltransferase Ste14
MATTIGWFVAEVLQFRHRRPGADRPEPVNTVVLVLGIAGGAVAANLVAHRVPAATIGPAVVVGWVGLVVLWVGVALRLWCFRTLGQYFTMSIETSPDQPVITKGPYAVVRHPSYAGLFLAIVGVGLQLRNWFSLACLVVGTLIGLVYRIYAEERALVRAIGQPYRDYMATHKRLIPYVW